MSYSSIIIATATLMLAVAGVANAAPQHTTATYGDRTVRCVMQGKVNSCEMARAMQIKGQTPPSPRSPSAGGPRTAR